MTSSAPATWPCMVRCAAVLAALACVRVPAARAEAGLTPEGTEAATVVTAVDGYARGIHFRTPAGVFYDKHRDELYVADRGNHKVGVFDRDGLPLRSFVHMVRYAQPGGTFALRPGEPSSVAVNSDGDILVVDGLDDVVDVVSYRGRSVKRLPVSDLVEAPADGKPKPAASAVAVTVDDQDRIYLALSSPCSQVVVLDRDYQVIRRIGTRGRDPGQFSAITGLSVDAQGRLLVTDAQAVPVQVFSPEGTLLRSFGAHDVGWQNFSLPSGVVRDGAGCLWVVDAIRQVVTRFDDTGRFIGAIGGAGVELGDMYYPVSIAGDGARRLFVLEKNGARFQVFQVGS